MSTADIRAYLVLSHGRAPQVTPIQTNRVTLARAGSAVHVSVRAIMTASAAAISGYTVNVLKRNGVEPTIAAHANVAAPGALSMRTFHRHATAAAVAPMMISSQTTAR